jgi:Fe-S cluster biogenesis protein NfuA
MSSKSEPIKISGQPTLDPMVCKFTVDHHIYPDGSFTCRDKDSAKGSPLLEALLEIEGIREIMVADQTLTIAKASDQLWPELGKKIGAVIREQITAGGTLISPDVAKAAPSEDKIRKGIEELFREEINPSISSHGGFVELASVEGSTVYVRLGGGCQGCASANQTLRQGIERAIRARLPEVGEVIDVTDHASGANPYL